MRKTPLVRKTPLKSSSRLSRSTPMEQNRTPLKKVNRERLDKRTKAYRAYMASEAWKGRRLAALIASDWTCQRCGHAPMQARYAEPTSCAEIIEARPLHVHHKTYARFMNERPEDLEVLCSHCHDQEHAGRFIRPRGLRGGR